MLSRRLGTNLVKMSSTIAKKQGVQQPHWTKPAKSDTDVPVLKIYNSLTRSKEEFIPARKDYINWYSCGPTVYDHSHMGHARNYVSTDICRRIMQDYFGYNIKFVQNITDIDDKIIIAARQQYLFEKYVLSSYPTIDDGLIQMAEEFLSSYIEKNLKEFDGRNIEKEFGAWADSVDADKLSVLNPKFSMHLRAARTAFNAIYSSKKMNVPEFKSSIRDISMPALDLRYGQSVTDPLIFKKLPFYWENKFNEDMAKLNVLPPSITTRVSEYVPEIIEFVEKIISNGFAYATEEGSVYFDTARFENDPKHDYAKLQPWNKGDMSLINDGEGSLSLVSVGKRSAADFALWKASKPGEPSWPSKWGNGRPGWHIECSVMASDVTGDILDIHSGGIDLCFPHHDNELAQSEAYFDSKQWVNYFMHNGHLHIQGQKMSKSLKNFITIDEALQQFTSRQLRLVFALNAWEKPIDFKDSLIKEVKAYESTMSKFFTNIRALNFDYKDKVQSGNYVSKKLGRLERDLYNELYATQWKVHAALCDNLSSFQTLKLIQDLVSKANNYIQSSSSKDNELRIEVLLEITRWITKLFDTMGFQARPDRLGWLDNSTNDSTNLEEALLPYIKSLSEFRDSVRNLAISKAEYSQILKACDDVRSKLLELNVSLDDRVDAPALIKFLNEQEKTHLLEQQAAKEKAQQEKEIKKQQQALANAKKEEERLRKMSIKPCDMFKDTSLYSEWDSNGLPLKDAKGEEISKSMKKKLTKQLQNQEKLYAEYLQASNK